MNKPIFSKGREKILECFYRNKNKEFYFSEILRETELTQKTTLNHLRVMVDNGIIILTKKGKNVFYRLNRKNPQVFSILSYFDYKIFNGLPGIRKRAIVEFIDSLKNKPLIALVFGSTARKTFTHESDIDIVLVFNKKEPKQEKLKKDIEATTGLNIEPFILDYDYFIEQLLKQEDAVIAHAIKTGFVMIGHYYFYKEILK